MVAVRVRRRQRIKLPKSVTGPTKVKVGFPSGLVNGAVVARAIWNHYGTSRGIPSRPFLLNAIRKNRRKYLEAMRTSAPKILRGEVTLQQFLSRLGILAQGDIQQEITNLRTPPNAPSTIAAKGSSNPLIDTGEMRQKVTWKVSR